jgi:hypothetical protein
VQDSTNTILGKTQPIEQPIQEIKAKANNSEQKPVSIIGEGAFKGIPAIGDIGRLATVSPKVPDSGDYRPDFTVDRVDIGGLKLGLASLRGLGHQDHGKPRQDSAAYAVIRDKRYLITAIADGMSSAPLSHLGADCTVKASLRAAEQALSVLPLDAQLNSVDWASVEEIVRTKLFECAKRLENTGAFRVEGDADATTYSRAIGTTAELLVVSTKAMRNGAYEFIRVVLSGDGSGYVRTKDGWVTLSAGKANAGELASNAIVPLPMKSEGFPFTQHGAILPGQAVLSVTDGIGDVGIGTDNDTSEFLFERLSEPLSAPELLRTLSFIVRAKDDDRTAAIVWAT